MSLVIPSLYYLSFLLLIVLAALVFQKNPRSPLHRLFALSCLALLCWLVTLFLFHRQSETALLTLLGRINFAAALLAVFIGYRFVRQLTGKPVRHLSGLTAETLLLAVLTLFTPLVGAAEYLPAGASRPVTVFGPLFPLYLLHVLGYLAAALFAAFSAARRARVARRLKSQLSLIGLGMAATAAVAVTTNLLLPYAFGNFAFQDIGALSTILFLSAVAYAISVHHLFDLRIALRRTIVFSLLLGFVLAVYGSVVLFLPRLLPGAGVRHSDALTLLGILVIAFSFDPLRRVLEEKTDRWLFRKEYERQQVQSELARSLSETVALEGALETILQALARVLHLRQVGILVFEPGEQGALALKKVKQVGYGSASRLLFRELDTVARHLGPYRRPVLVAALAKEGDEAAAVMRKLAALRIEAALPLHRGEELVGLMLLGEKASGAPFSPQDLGLVEGVGIQAVSAIQKAVYFESDQRKSEFVSVAAHELTTPLTAVQWYLSMILDDRLGQVDEKAEGYLVKARASLERLSLLVKDLLSVSRLEAGRVQITPRAVEVAPLLEEAVDQLLPLARQKKLRLTLQPSAAPLPPVWADPARTMEVLVNLIGNAIKYTERGGITVSAEVADPAASGVRVEIADTGIGMDKAAQAHLFEKFYRVATEKTRDIPGTGLGLYITRSYVEKMGGSLTLESAPGVGSTFRVTLPLAPAEASPPQEGAVHGEPTYLPPAG